MATPSPTFDVFLSHNSKDKPAVRELAEIFKSHSLNPWLDETDVPLGQTWQPEAELAIRTVRSALVLIGPHGLGPWQAIEAQSLVTQSINRQLPVIPVLLPGAPDKPDLPTYLAEFAYLDLRAGLNDQAINGLIQTISAQQSPSPDAPQRVSPSRLPHTSEHLVGRDYELNRLHSAWSDRKTHVFTLVAWGGVGKTALISRWAAQLAQRNYDHADYFDWSFYSQGSHEHSAASADLFIATALTFFGDPAMANSPASPWDKGARLAHLIAQRRTLLILDGLEPLQHPPTSPANLAGQLKDPALSALLRGLAQHNPGLCLITTRQSLTDLAPFHSTTAPQWPLTHLSTPASIDLLKRLGVQGSQQEFESLATDVKGHALTLTLIGRYLFEAHHGDIRKRDLVKLQEADYNEQSGHAFHVVHAYETWLASSGDLGLRALAILSLMGLFDRPADAGCITALRHPPAIPGLTDPLINLPDPQWNQAITPLTTAGLLSEASDQSAIDSHPLIREYFATQLKSTNPAALRSAHKRLYEHLRDSTPDKENPTYTDLQPLYRAIPHACHAGLHEDALYKVYVARILRGTGHDGHYSWKKLGTFASDLAAVACFFDQPWQRLAPTLSEVWQAWLLNQAALYLRALGRLTEAREPMRAGLQLYVNRQNWAFAARLASNLSELDLTLGDIPAAIRDVDHSVAFADRSADACQRVVNLTTHADALHQAGRRDDALARFREAEQLQAQVQPQCPLLYSLRGFHYCDLFLAAPERAAWLHLLHSAPAVPVLSTQDSGLLKIARQVEQRAAQTLPIAERNHWLLDIALNHLTLARCAVYSAILDPSSTAHRQLAIDRTNSAHTGLRHAADMTHVPRALLTRALLHHALLNDSTAARADLDEAWEIASRGPMRLRMADILLTRARLFKDRQALADARTLITDCGYHRRDQELADATQAAASWPSP